MIVDNSSITAKDLKQQVLTIWDQLQNQKFFQRFSLVDKITKDNLSLINEAEIVIRALIVKQLTVFDFYMTFVEFYHQQQIKKQQELGRMINTESFMIDLFNFSQSLAIHLTKNELTQIKYIQKGQLVLRYTNQQSDLEENWMDAYFDDFQPNGDYKKLVRSCILITQKGGSHSFTHKSIQEFYVGHFLLKLLDDIKIINEDDYKTQIQDLNIQHLMAKLKQKNLEQQYVLSQVEQLGYSIYNSLINKNSFNLSSVNYKGVLSLIKNEIKLQLNLKQKLIQIVKLSQTSDQFIRASSNSLYLLSYNNEFLGNLELKNIKISDIQLIGVSFYGSDMENSQFSNVGVSSCNFSKTNMKNAQWKNIQFDELHSLQNKQRINSIVFSKNGQTLISAHSDQIVFWDIKNGIKNLTLFKSELFSESQLDKELKDLKTQKIVVSPNDQILAISWYQDFWDGEFLAYEHSAIQLVNLKTEKSIGIWFFKNNFINSFIISSDNITLALCSHLHTVELLNISENQWTSLSGHKGEVNSILFTLDNENLVSCCQNSEIILWNLKNKTILTYLKGHEASVKAINLSFDGSTLASCSGKTIKIWNLSKYEELFDLVGHDRDVEYLQFLPDRQTLVSWGQDKIILMWDTFLGKQIRSIKRLYKASWWDPVCFSLDYQIMAFQIQNEIELWDIQVGKKISEIGGQSKQMKFLAFQPPTENGSQILASVMDNDIIQLWDTKIQNNTIKLDGHKLQVNFVGYSPDGLLLYSYGQDNTIKMWNSKEGKYIQSLENIKKCSQIKFSTQGEFLFIIAELVYLWYFRENRLVTIQEENLKSSLSIGQMKVSPNRNIIGWSFTENNQNDPFQDKSLQNKIKLFDINLRKQVALLEVKQKGLNSMNSITFSPDCQFLISMEYNWSIEIWDLKTYKSIFTHDDVENIMFSPNSRILCVINKSEKKKVRLFNLQLIEIAFLDIEGAIQFSPNSQIIAAIKEKEIILWNSEDGKQIAILSGHQQNIKTFQFSPNGSVIASYANEKIIYLWDVQEYKLLKVLEGHQEDIKGFVFCGNDQMLASFSKDFSIILWNFIEGTQITILKEHKKQISNLLFSPNDEILVSYDDNYQIFIWKVATWEKITMYQSEKYLTNFTFSPDSKTLCFIKDRKKICVLNLQEYENIKYLQGHCDYIQQISFSADGSILISQSNSYDSCILLWDMSTFQLINIIEGDRAKEKKILLSNDDQKLAINYGDRQIRLYDTDNGQQTGLFEQHKHLIEQILFSPDSNHLASCSRDLTIKLWDVKDVKNPQLNAIASLEGHIDLVRSIIFSPNSGYLVSLSNDLNIRVYDVQTKQQSHQILLKKDYSILRFSPDQKHFAYSQDVQIYFWNYQDQSLYFEYKMEKSYSLKYMEFAKKGRWLIIFQNDTFSILDIEQTKLFRKIKASEEAQFQFILDWWDVQKEQQIAVFEEHQNQINQFAISPDKSVMASCGRDTTIKFTSISDILEIQENSKKSKILSSFKTLAIYSPMIAFQCQIQGASIKSSMDWNMKQLFLQKGAMEKEI